jgi:hypothetical protein
VAGYAGSRWFVPAEVPGYQNEKGYDDSAWEEWVRYHDMIPDRWDRLHAVGIVMTLRQPLESLPWWEGTKGRGNPFRFIYLYFARISFLRIFPWGFLGRESTNSTDFGDL